MTKNFWLKLKKPFFALAPLANVTDPAFRYIIAKYSKFGGQDIGEYGEFNHHLKTSGGPDIIWTEFVSADGLFRGGKENLMKDLIFTEAERPIVAQFFTSSPEMMEKAANLAVELGFDGVDINMGCPDRSVEKQGAGAALCKNPELARRLISSAWKGTKGKIPVSVKIRLGYNKDELDLPAGGWLPNLLKESPSAVIIHLRTRREMSKVPAHWERIARAVEIRDQMKSDSLIVGNGDSLSLEDAHNKAKKFGCDGVMLGRAIFGKPYLFSNSHELENRENPESIKKILEILIEHVNLFEDLLSHKDFNFMKKHFKAYVSGWPGAKELRIKLMEAGNAREVENIIKNYLDQIYLTKNP